MIPTREQAWDLLCEYNEGEFHRLHARIVGDVMRYFAVELGYDDEADFWQTVGILHDLDFEQYPDQHCTKEAEILREKGVDERLVHAVVSHGYLLTVAPFYWLLGLLAVYRTSIQSMQNGKAPFAACMIELVMRIAATVGLSGIIGYTSVCIASPMAWIGACALLIPVYYKMMKGNCAALLRTE